jgi:predicted nuclease of restriction endonuclease-like (RecB) superfamily
MEKEYVEFIKELKQNIIQSRYHAMRLANREQLLLYYRTGSMLCDKINNKKWGTKVLQQIADDLQKSIPGIRGFSHRNLKNMKQLYEVYENSVIGQSLTAQLRNSRSIGNQPDEIWQSLAAKLDSFFGISFTHHILILNKCSKIDERLFYINKAATEFLSVSLLEYHIESGLFEKQGKLPSNFSKTIELKHSATQVFNDEYLMDYMNIGDNADERQVESSIVTNIRDFILRMGKGFSFIGNQFRIELDGEEFFIDLLFYNRHLQCLVAFELKRGKFKPEYAGKLNFYLNVLDEKIKLPHENSSIGIVLCKEKNNVMVEYTVKSITKPMGVATFRTTKEMPDEMKDILPDTNELSKLL